ncbi:MAG: GTP cyclohydrolase [Alphaproteobacteria bacterium CG_4_9_14_3_um_filter_47_13]|nr:MAG: GTP cyclohydrolase [Alphaproteobacteria bacterium CG_4_9_14_3_um_filter_47_13]
MTAEHTLCQKTDKPAIRAQTPLILDNGIETRIISFKNLCDDKEHIALVFPNADFPKVPLVRLHSECLTGDVFGSAQCDCGDQLHEAKTRMGAEGGILLYLRQEGRGIGLYNKLDAYKAQHDLGLDTFAANTHIGFAEDMRSFTVAAEMLQAMGVRTIRLLTNNPDKVAQLQMTGIVIEQVIPTGFFEKLSNRRYLQTKRDKGHLL